MTTTTFPLGVAALPEGTVACADCGMPTTDDPHDVRIAARRLPDGRIEDIHGYVTVGLCASCRGRQNTAAAIVRAHPMPQFGSQRILAERLGRALGVFAALGQEPPVDWDRRRIADALDRLEYPAAALAWVNRFVPVITADARRNTAAAEPWLFAPLEAFADARRALAEWLIDGMSTREFTCPTTACMCCGIDTATGRRQSEAWVEVVGHKRRPGGHLCRKCTPFRDGDTIGPSMIDAAVAAMLDPDRTFLRKRENPPRWIASRPWADTGATTANTERFGHLPLRAMRRTLERGTW